MKHLVLRDLVMGRVAVFIDASNILYSQKTLGWKVDYLKLKKHFSQECDLCHIAFYTGKVGSHDKQASFLKKLLDNGIGVVSKDVKFIKTEGGLIITKGNLDVEIALDCFRARDNFDTLVLFSGDSDFAYLIDLLKELGKRVIVVSTRNHISRELVERAKFVPLDKLREAIEYKVD